MSIEHILENLLMIISMALAVRFTQLVIANWWLRNLHLMDKPQKHISLWELKVRSKHNSEFLITIHTQRTIWVKKRRTQEYLVSWEILWQIFCSNEECDDCLSKLGYSYCFKTQCNAFKHLKVTYMYHGRKS